jgi:uncharacterized membrane protein
LQRPIFTGMYLNDWLIGRCPVRFSQVRTSMIGWLAHVQCDFHRYVPQWLVDWHMSSVIFTGTYLDDWVIGICPVRFSQVRTSMIGWLADVQCDFHRYVPQWLVDWHTSSEIFTGAAIMVHRFHRF